MHNETDIKKTIIVKVDPENIDGEIMENAAGIIKRGGLVAFPTETVYGLGANALDSGAAEKIYAAKGRPQDNPLIVHVADLGDFEKYCIIENKELFYKLASRFMPGPLTIIQKKSPVIPYSVTAGLETVAIRFPANKIARRLIELSSLPIAAPSANLSGKPSPTLASHVVDDLDGRADMIIDGGPCTYGLESTVISIVGGNVRLLRPGAVTAEQLGEACGNIYIDPAVRGMLKDNERPLAPGMKYRHYAPKAPVTAVGGNDAEIVQFFADKLSGRADTGILCYDEDKEALNDMGFSGENIISFGKKDELREQAKSLFDCLRHFDRLPVKSIYTRIPSDEGIGLAVFNRLLKACGFNMINI